MRGEPTKIKSMYKIIPASYQKMSRYRDLYRLVNEDNKTYIETPRKFKIKESTKDVFYSVEQGYENRLDLISYKFYNTPFLWWVIASVNNLHNPMKVEVGLVLRIPNRSDLFSPGGILANTLEDEKWL